MHNTEKRFKELLKGPHSETSYNHLIYSVISDQTMVEEGYLDCVGLVLLAKPSGILHWTTDEIWWVDTFIELLYQHGSVDLKGLPVSGSPKRAGLLEERLRHHNIPILEGYRDHFDTGLHPEKGKVIMRHGKEETKHPQLSYWRKTIIVNSPTEEVLLHSERSGYKQLHPLN